MTLFFLRCCTGKSKAKPEIELQEYPSANPTDAKKLRLLEIFQARFSQENAMFLCEYRDILIEQEQATLETLRAQVANLFNRYIINEQAVELCVNGRVFSTEKSAFTINISDQLKSQVKKFPIQTATEAQIYAQLSSIYKDLMHNVVTPVLRENNAMDVLALFTPSGTSDKKKSPLAALSKSSRGRMVSAVVETSSQRAKKAEKDDDGNVIKYARPTS